MTSSVSDKWRYYSYTAFRKKSQLLVQTFYLSFFENISSKCQSQSLKISMYGQERLLCRDEAKRGQKKVSHLGEGPGKGQKMSCIRNEGPGEGQKVLYPDEGRRGSKNVRMRHERANKSYIRRGQERVKECQDETWEGQQVLYPDEGRRELKNVRLRHERAKKPFIRMRACRRELKNVRMRHGRAKKSYIRMRARES